MPNLIDINKSPYGLNGGMILSGSISASMDGFWYYPITASFARVQFSNMDSGSNISGAFQPGIGVYGKITSVSQSNGIAIVYYGAPDPIRY